MQKIAKRLINDGQALVRHNKKYYLFSELLETHSYSLKSHSIEQIRSVLREIKISDSFSSPMVIQINYELAWVFLSDESKLARLKDSDDSHLFTIYKYKNIEEVHLQTIEQESISRPCFKIDETLYAQMFNKVMNHLERGDCYQLNLTHVFKDRFDQSNTLSLLEYFISRIENHSHYFHVIANTQTKELLLSNSPESLFEINGNKLETRPIKGTVKKEQGLRSLLNSSKDQAELNIITDLLRNDLSAIGKSFSKVDLERGFFEVPGLIQQYSQVSVSLDEDESLLKVLEAIFPGGSITGAPKKRVLDIIDEIELTRRGFYTGSTIFLSDLFKKSSINIRTSKIANGHIYYGAGGGITINSSSGSEFEEMNSKISSYLDVFFI